MEISLGNLVYTSLVCTPVGSLLIIPPLRWCVGTQWKKEMGADIRSSPTLNSRSSVLYIGVMNEAHVDSHTGGIYALDSSFRNWYNGRGGRVLASHEMKASCAGTPTLTKSDSMAFIGCEDGRLKIRKPVLTQTLLENTEEGGVGGGEQPVSDLSMQQPAAVVFC